MPLKITTSSDRRPVIWLYGDIGAEYGGITANEFRQTLASIPDNKDIDLRVHSDGGNFHEGIAMHSLLARRAGDTFGIVDGLAASAATFPLMACKTIEMSTGAWLMIHQARGALNGENLANDFRDAADRLDATNTQIHAIYKSRWKGSEKQLAAALEVDTWLDATTAVKLGLADSISEAMAVAAHVNVEKFHYKNVPKTLVAAKAGDDFLRLKQAEVVLAELFTKEDQLCDSK